MSNPSPAPSPSNALNPQPPIDPSRLCNPYTGEPLALEADALVSTSSGQRFPIRNGIPSFIINTHTPRRNRFYRWFYDRAAFAYDFTLDLGPKLNYGAEADIRRDYIAQLPINPGDTVLETAVGTALNIPHLPNHAVYYGLDISYNMLGRAQRNLAEWNRSALLFHADAQFLPFHDNTFELVFQMGGLQFMADPFKAVREMARVAVPGAAIIIIDEASAVLRTFKRLPAHAPHVTDQASVIAALPRLVPQGMASAAAKLLPSGEFYALNIQKPKDY